MGKSSGQGVDVLCARREKQGDGAERWLTPAFDVSVRAMIQATEGQQDEISSVRWV